MSLDNRPMFQELLEEQGQSSTKSPRFSNHTEAELLAHKPQKRASFLSRWFARVTHTSKYRKQGGGW